MNAGRAIRSTLVFLILVSLHYAVRPLLDWRAEIDFLVIALLLAAVRLRPGAAAILGLIAGFASDSLSPGAFGSGALALSVVGFAASWLKAVFFADNVAINAFFFFAGKWAVDIIYVLTERRLGGLDLVSQLLLWSPLSAAVTAVAGVALLLLFKPVLEAPTS
jgi:rod shape-determining protein MreD